VRHLSVQVVAIILALGNFSSAQTAPGTLHGQVKDPSGAVVSGATVSAIGSNSTIRSATTDRAGSYQIGNLPPGTYTVTTNAQGFAIFEADNVQVAAGEDQQFNIALDIQVEKQKLEVQEESSEVQVSPSNNASAIVLKGADLDALPDDPDELEADLQALAGPSAGPNGGQIYIDGFTAGQLPPKASIREIRINQNPFSAEYDKLGYGRIEIFTKPGTDKFHGQMSVEGNSSAFNSRNPYLDPSQEQPYYSTMYMGNIGGPLSKKASFFFDFQRRNIDEIAIVNATVLDTDDPNLAPIQFSQSVSNPRMRTNLGPRFDYQVSKNNTLTARYQYFHDTQDNAGIGRFSLPSTGYDTTSSEHTVQLSDTQIFGSKIVNETRFQYIRNNSRQDPLSTDPTVNVPGSFTSGGSSAGLQTDHSDHYELQNYTSLAMGKHFLKFGGRLRVAHESGLSGAGFNGSFTFPDIATYQAAELILAGGAATAPGANQFTLSATSSGAIPTVTATVVDAGLYVQDDWRVRSNLTVSAGLRFETQNAIQDHGDWAPRLGFAWGIGGGGKSAPKTVLRGGFGMFYDRFPINSVLNVNRMDGVTQQQYLVSICGPGTPGCPNPPPTIDFFPTVPAPSDLPPSQTVPTIYQINSRLRAPYVIQTAASLERQVTKSANVSVSYIHSNGVHQFLSWNANAPLPGTGLPPIPGGGNIYQYASEGVFRQNQLIANFNIRAGAKLTLFGFYSLNYANADTAGASSFPTNQYDIGVDYGRAAYDVRHRVFMGGTIGLPRGFRLSPFMVVNSGSPYNVTLGEDLNLDSIINDRPPLATGVSGICVSPTEACHYNANPTLPYTAIPVNYLTGPAQFTLNLRLAKTFSFGPERGGTAAQGNGGPGGPGGFGGAGRGPGGGGPGGGGGGGGFGRGGGGGPFGGAASGSRRYSLTFSVNARNVLNHVNPGVPVGNLSSPLFGTSNSLAGGPFSSSASNRRIELQAMFSF